MTFQTSTPSIRSSLCSRTKLAAIVSVLAVSLTWIHAIEEPAHAAQSGLTLPDIPPRSGSTDDSQIELSGIVLDRTITRFGKDFFFFYAGYWRDIPSTEGLTVVIHEQVFPQAGTRLWVELEQETIFQTYFGRRHTDVRKVAEQAILISLDKVIEHQARAAADSILQQLQ